MIRWEYLPCAMAPDTEYDGAGCFSGSAVPLEDGRLLLIYTGCDPDDTDQDGRWAQTQCVAVSCRTEDGETEFIKYQGNPVITGKDLPRGGDPYEFRDPYIWRTGDGTYRAVVSNANKCGNRASQICLYRSCDGFSWEFDKILFEDNDHIGIMWECPDFFPLGSRYVLMASPMNMDVEEADGSIRFPKGNNVCYIVGDYDEDCETFITMTNNDHEAGSHEQRTAYFPVDCGLDFYAPQVMKTPDGRCVMIGWMQDPSTSNAHDEKQFRIFGQMTVPRELSLKYDRLVQWPVCELESYRDHGTSYTGLILENEELSLPGIEGRILDIELSIQRGEAHGQQNGDADGTYEGKTLTSFVMRVARMGDVYTEIRFDPERSLMSIDRSRAGQIAGAAGRRSIRVEERSGRLDLRILLDRHSIEIFINGGEQVMSASIYTPPRAQEITFSAQGAAEMDVTAYRFRR